MDKWAHKDSWRRYGTEFCVEVQHFTVEPSRYLPERDDGGHRWTVNAYIYPAHPMFGEFSEDGHIFQPACNALPLHAGASLLKFPRDANGVTSVHVAADYNHLGDNRYTRMETRDDARAVFNDADELLDHLEALASARGGE